MVHIMLFRHFLFSSCLLFGAQVMADPAIDDSTSTGSISVQAGEAPGGAGERIIGKSMESLYNGAVATGYFHSGVINTQIRKASVRWPYLYIYQSQSGYPPFKCLITSGVCHHKRFTSMGGGFLHLTATLQLNGISFLESSSSNNSNPRSGRLMWSQ